MGFRWYCLLPPLADDVPATAVCRTTFLAALSNYSPLGDYGGMTFRVAFLIRRGCPRIADAVLSVVLDRLIGLAGLLMMSWTAIPLLRIGSHSDFAPALRNFQIVSMAGLAGVAALYALTGLRGLRHRRLVRQPRQFVAWTLGRLVQQRRQVALAAGCSFVSQVFAVLALTCAAAAIARGQQIPDLLQHAAILPIVELSSLLLPTPSGIGVREFALSQLYHDAMPDATIAEAGRLGFLVAITLRLATFASTLLGALSLSILHWRWQPSPIVARYTAAGVECGRTRPTHAGPVPDLPHRSDLQEIPR